MSDQWYYARGENRSGPVTTGELRRLAAAGELVTTDLVWKEGMQKWVPANTLKGLFPSSAMPPPLPTERDVAPAPEPLDPDPPADERPQSRRPVWSKHERDEPNPTLRWFWAGVIAGIVVGCVCLCLCVVEPVIIIGTLWPFAIAGVLYQAQIWPGSLRGRWEPTDGTSDWIEFLRDGVFKSSSGSVGTYKLLPNQKFIDIRVPGRPTKSWKVLVWNNGGALGAGLKGTLELQDATGKVRTFRRGKTLAQKQASFWYTDRITYLHRKWEPVSGEGPAIQFTEDGAFIRFDGFAAKYTFGGEEPNEVITIHIDEERSIRLKVISLGQDEMVLTGVGGSMHYRRGTSVTDAEAQRRADAAREKLKKVGKAVLVTAGVIGAGIAILGVAAGVAAAAASSTTCARCGRTWSGLHTNCPHCTF